MLNHYPWWKYALLIVVVVSGALYALPNLFEQAPAVEITATRDGVVDQTLYSRVESELNQEGLAFRRLELQGNRLSVQFPDTDTQLKAADELRLLLGRNYTVAMNLMPTTPDLLQSLGLDPMYLGLDLRGGVHFLMEVDMAAVVAQAYDALADDARGALRGEVRGARVRSRATTVEIDLRRPEDLEPAQAIIAAARPEVALEVVGADRLRLTLPEEFLQERQRFALEQNLTTLRNRVNELGVAEPVIQRQGLSRIVVELPGVQDTARAKEILGATATLEFRLVDMEGDAQAAAANNRAPVGSELYSERNGRPVLLERRVIITGDRITDAASGIEQQTGSPAVFINLDGQGARRMAEITGDNIGNLMAVLFIETRTEPREVNGEVRLVSYTTEEVINVATIRDRLSNRFQITGLDSPDEARNLALLLRAGALAAPIRIVEERTVGPSAGRDNVRQGFQSALVAFLLVLGFMAFYYRAFGLVSDAALTVNLVLIVAALSALQATLTLPGIAGIILTIGMAVDANVLIFERIREELALGNSPQAAIHTGFKQAFSTILDANLTTLIAAIVLFGFGTGPIKGFAITLSIGIVTSMFTAIFAARGVINWVYGGRRLQTLPI